MIVGSIFPMKTLAVDIPSKTCSNGAVNNSSVTMSIRGSIGQPIVHKFSSVSMSIKSGFLPGYMAIDNTRCFPGDANNDNDFDILDIVFVINYKYKEGPAPIPVELCSGDATCDCETDILDIVYLINYKYKSGLPPCNYQYWHTTCE
ncbi:MAG: hypothetical protein GY865_11785 [candidate division Zixibacteria bacterium]|nr:hypothetical protein [candidate division Zixibacteria bacterium]